MNLFIIDIIKSEINKILKNCFSVKSKIEFNIEKTKNLFHGDYSSNVAMICSKLLKKNPIEIAEIISKKINSIYIKKIEIAGPGFLNFFLDEKYYLELIKTILNEKESYPLFKQKEEKLYNVEYVSANPTGDLHIGHARNAVFGSTLSNVFKKYGINVDNEYYINDSGNQINSTTKITSTKVELKEVNDAYVVETTNNGSLTSEQIPYDEAYSMMSSIFFTGDSPFRYGGLFYGEYFQANSHKYGDRYILENNNLTFKIENDKTMFEGATCNQEITIDSFGMLIFCEEEVIIDRTKNRAVYNINGIYNQ